MREDPTRAGRPRDPGRDEAILTAALALLGEVPYERLTVRAIARRAGVGLATMYRRWPTKEELVVAAVNHAAVEPLPEPQPDHDPVEMLVDLVVDLEELLMTRGGLVSNVIGQLPFNPTLAEALRPKVIQPRLDAVAAQIASIPGVTSARAQRLAEQIPAAVMFDVLLLGRRPGKAEARQLVDTVLRGIH